MSQMCETQQRKLSLPVVLLFCSFSLFLELSGTASVQPRTDFSLDSTVYLKMVQDGPASVPAPYRYRVLLPAIAAMSPLSPQRTLFAITHVCLFGMLVMAMLCCWETGASAIGCIGGATTLFCSRVFLFNYQNPYLTDAAGQLVLFLMFYFCLRHRYTSFALSAIPGLLIRESTVFLVPGIIFTKKWKRGLAVCALCAVCFLIPRFAFRSDYSAYLKSGNLVLFNLHHMDRWLKGFTLSWYLAWPLLPVGIVLLRRHALSAGINTCLLFLGAFVASFIAGDTERMFTVLAPAVAVASAQVYQSICEVSKPATVLLFAVFAGEFSFANPYLHGSTSLRMLAAFSIFAVPAIVYVITRLPLRRELRQKLLSANELLKAQSGSAGV